MYSSNRFYIHMLLNIIAKCNARYMYFKSGTNRYTKLELIAYRDKKRENCTIIKCIKLFSWNPTVNILQIYSYLNVYLNMFLIILTTILLYFGYA